MNDIAASASAAERTVSERLRNKLNQLNSSAQSHLFPVQDHINFTLQQAYFKCAYECFDSTRKEDEISNCVEHCSVPVLKAQNLVEGEMAQFQERMQRSIMVCQDKYESSKLNPGQSNAVSDLESCVDQSINDGIGTLPHLVEKLKRSLGMWS